MGFFAIRPAAYFRRKENWFEDYRQCVDLYVGLLQFHSKFASASGQPSETDLNYLMNIMNRVEKHVQSSIYVSLKNLLENYENDLIITDLSQQTRRLEGITICDLDLRQHEVRNYRDEFGHVLQQIRNSLMLDKNIGRIGGKPLSMAPNNNTPLTLSTKFANYYNRVRMAR